MRERETPLQTPKSRHYTAVEIAGRAYTFRRLEYSQWLQLAPDLEDMAQQAIALASVRETLTEESTPEDHRAAIVDTGRALEFTEASAGLIILRCWTDPATVLEARERYDAMGYRDADDPTIQAGRDAYVELLDSGWDDEDVLALSQALTKWCHERVQSKPNEVQRRARFFSEALANSPTG